MRRASIAICSLACLAILGCSEDAKKQVPAGPPSPAAKPAAEAPAPPPAPVPKREGPAISGRASLADPAEQGELTLSIGGDDRVTGALTLGASRLELTGLRDGDALRGWLARPCGDAAAISRGTLYGAKNAKGWSGSITIAGNGGDGPRAGTWTAGQ
jgi:hypothetical protein